MTQLLAPYAGRVLPLGSAPDPVFAAEMVGSGIAIDPVREPGEALAPVDGTVVKLHPHAFVITTAAGVAVLVHLGIDTVHLKDQASFDLLICEGDSVIAGQPLITWDPAQIESLQLNPMVLVCVLDTPAGSVDAPQGAPDIRAGDALFAI